MKLQTRLTFTATAVSLVVAAAASIVEAEARRQQVTAVLHAHVDARLLGDGLSQCERDPEGWARAKGPPSALDRPEPRHPHGPPPFAEWAYDRELRPSVAQAPLLDEGTVAAARAGQRRVRGAYDHGDQLLAWAGGDRCGWVLSRMPRPPLLQRAFLPLLRDWALPLFAMLAAIVVGLVPALRRARLLAREVREAARGGYRRDITTSGGDEISELAQAFADASREVRAALDAQEARERTLREFLASTTHDVMTPLTVLQGHLAALAVAGRAGERVDTAQVAAAVDELSYTTSLVRNLEVAARLEAGAPHMTRSLVDLGALALRVVTRHRPLARQRSIEIELGAPEAPVFLEGDETFIEQALSNVVLNAVHHHRPEGGHVAIVLERGAAGRFELRVLDDGPGVPENELPALTQQRVRGDAARTRHPGGRGLGLAIVQQVCDRHGLTLTLANGQEGGFVVTLGCTSAEPPRTGA